MSTASSVTLNNSSDTSSASAATLSSAAASVTSSASKLSENSKKEQANSAANKQKFSALNINNLYKGKSLENPKTSVVVPKHGLQTVGKVGAGRRVPPPANIPSLKSSSPALSHTNNTSTTASSSSNSGSNLVNSSVVNIVPTGGQGWAASGKDDFESVSNKLENSTCPSTTDSVSTTSSTSNDILAAVPPPTTGGSSRSSSQGGPIHHSGSSERLTSTLRQPIATDRRQADPYFAQEFPQLSSTTGGNSLQPQSAKDLSNARQGSRGGGSGPYHGEGNRNNHNLSYNYKDIGPNGAEEDISLLATNMSLDGQNESLLSRPSRNNNKSNNIINNSHHYINVSSNDPSASTSISSNPNFLLPDPPISSATNVPNSSNPLSNQQQRNYNSQQQFSSSQSSQYERNSSNHYRNKQKTEKRYMPTIISDKELKSLDQILNEKECTWALEAEIDYEAKLDFSDYSSEDESENQKKSSSSATNSSNKPVIDSFKKPLTSERPGREPLLPETGQYRDGPPDDSLGPKVHTLGSAAPFRQDPNRTSYVGRKSDSVYEFNRKDQEYDVRREYYRESHRSQQLPRGNGARDAYSGNPNTYQQAPIQQAVPVPVQPPPPSQSSSSSSRTSTLDREKGSGCTSSNKELSGPRTEGGKKSEIDENWRPKRMQEDITSAVMRGRQMREDEDEEDIVESSKKSMGPVASGADELILPSKNIPPQKDIRGGEDMRPYDRRREDGGYSRGGERERDRDRYALSKNQYATNLPPRLQRQAEMQYREQSQRSGPRGQPIDGRYDDSRMRNSDRGDDLFEPRRGDRRTPEDASSVRSSNVRTETGSWRNSNASQRKPEERRDSQIEQTDSLNAPISQPSQLVNELKSPKDGDEFAFSRKTSYDSNSSKIAENPATCDSGRKLSAADSTTFSALAPVAASQPDLNKPSNNKLDPLEISSITTTQPKEVSPTISKVTERSELIIDSIDQKPKDSIDTLNIASRLSDMDAPQRSRSNLNDPQINRANNYDQSKRTLERGRDSGRGQTAVYGSNSASNRSDGRRYPQQPLLSHPDSGREFHRHDQRNISQPQHQQTRRDSYRNVPQQQQFEPSNRPPLLGAGPKSLQLQHTQHYEQKVEVEPKKVQSFVQENQRQTPPQPVATPPQSVQTNASQSSQQIPTISQQQQGSSVMYPPAAPTAGATNIRAVRTAYGPPASKAAFGGGEAVVNKQHSPPIQSVNPPQQSLPSQDNSRTQEPKAPLLSLPTNPKGQSQIQQQPQSQHSIVRSSEQAGQRGSGRGRSDSNRNTNSSSRPERSDTRENRDSRYRSERRGDRDRKLSTSSKNSVISNSAASGTLSSVPMVPSPNSAYNNNNQKAESDDVNNDEWETASDNSENLETSHATLDRNANITASANGAILSAGVQNRRNPPSKGPNNNNERDSRSQKSGAIHGQDSRAFRGDERREREPRGRRDRERRSNEQNDSNYRAPRGGERGGSGTDSQNYRSGRGERDRANDINRGRSGSYRTSNPPNAPAGKGAPGQSVSGTVPRNQDVIVNAVANITLDDAKLAQKAIIDASKLKQQPPRKNSSNASLFNHIGPGGDYIDEDLYLDGEFDYNQPAGGKNNGRRGRSSSNASSANKSSSKRKERSKSKGRGRGGREGTGGNRSGGGSNQVSSPKGPIDPSSKPQTVGAVSVASSGISTDSKQQAKSDTTRPSNQSNSDGRNQNNAKQGNFGSSLNRNNSDSKTAAAAIVISQQQLPPAPGSVGSSHPSTSSTKSNSFDQHDSGIESGDQPPSTSSTSTSQRSSPSNDDNKVVSSTANNSSKLTTTTNSSSSVKCAITTTSTTDSKVKSKSDSLNITKIPEMDTSATNINNRKIGTLIYENTKLKEENKVLSKIDEGVDPSTLPKPPAVPHPSSSVAEELNLKFASVKKVWDNPPPANDSTERKNSLLTSLSSPVEKNFTDKNKSTASIGGSQVSTGGPMTSPPPMLTPASYQAGVPVGQYGGQNSGTAGFHQNVVQTPTSPPTALAPIYTGNPMAPNQGVAGGPFPFGQMEPAMNPFANANPHQNQMHSVIPHFMPVQPGGAAQQNVAAFNQHVAINPAAAALLSQHAAANQANLFAMAQLAHHQAQSQQHEHMNKFSMNQPNNMLANNILKTQQFVGQPNQAASGGHHQAAAAAALHQQAQQQGTANWAASQAAQGQQPQPHPYANPIAHFVQAGAPGQQSQQQSQQFSRQQNAAMNRNAIDQSQAQSQNALRSIFQANMLADAMQNQLNHHAQFMHHNPHHNHHHHDPSRQPHAAALQQASRQGGQAPFQQNPMNQSWPNHAMAQQQMLLKTAMQSRQLMQMFAAGNAAGQPIPPMGANVPMGMPGNGGANNHRTSPSGSLSMGNSYPAPIQRPNNNGSGGNQSGKNGSQYNNNRNGTGGGKSFGGPSKGGNRNNYYNHNNRNSSTPSPSAKSASISSDINGTGGPANNLPPNNVAAVAVDCSTNVNKD